jgi:hypothetical protein
VVRDGVSSGAEESLRGGAGLERVQAAKLLAINQCRPGWDLILQDGTVSRWRLLTRLDPQVPHPAFAGRGIMPTGDVDDICRLGIDRIFDRPAAIDAGAAGQRSRHKNQAINPATDLITASSPINL